MWEWIDWKISIGTILAIITLLAGGIVAVHKVLVRMDRIERRVENVPSKEDFREIVVKVTELWSWFSQVLERRGKPRLRDERKGPRE